MTDFSEEQRKSRWPCSIGLVTTSSTAVLQVANRPLTICSDRFSSRQFPKIPDDSAPVWHSLLSVENSLRARAPTVTAVGNRRALNRQLQDRQLQVKFSDQF